jgi:hypothetical protein
LIHFRLGFGAIQSVYGPHERSPHMPKPNARDAFLARKNEIDALLARLTAHSGDHFGFCPDEINWGHVGTLDHYTSLLRQISDSAFREGEFAA